MIRPSPGVLRLAPLLLISTLVLAAPSALRPGELPGNPQMPYGPVAANLHWQVHSRGLSSYIADDLHGYPHRTDRSVTDGIPLDAFSSWPFSALFGDAFGLWIWALSLIWASGMAAALLGMRWWGRWEAGLITGIGWQVSEGWLREIGDGRYHVAFAASFLPLILICSLEGRKGKLGGAVLAGVGAGVAGLSDPSLAAAAFMLAALPLLGTWRRLPMMLTAWAATLGVPAAWIYSGLREVPSMSMDPWSEALIDFSQQRPVDIVATRIYGWHGVMMASLLRPVLAIGVYGVVKHFPLQRWRFPALIGLIAVIFGLGPSLPGPLVLPAGWLLELPLLERAWWSDRWWLVVGLCLAWVAGGIGPSFLKLSLPHWVFSFIFSIGLLTEARLLSPSLPWPTVPLPPSDSARILAAHPDVPFVLLPLPGGRFRPDHLELIDQITHGRPLAHGTRPPFDLTAPDTLLRAWQQNAGLRALAACETGQAANPNGRESADL
jgi:hypothetical protein